MKKIKYLLLLAMASLFFTGCVKYEATMNIKDDKSMEYSLIYALDSSYFSGTEIVDEDGKEALEKAGYVVEDYDENGYEGVKITLKVKNIDSISGSESVTYSVSDFSNYKKDDKIFKVEKGLFKNVYTAQFVFESSDSDLDNDDDLSLQDDDDDDYGYDDDDYDYGWDDDDDYDYGWDDDDDDDDANDSDIDYSQYMDLTFTVNLPYKAISSNATKTSNEGKKLKWVLSSSDIETIEFQFELYNMGLFYCIVGIVIAIIAVVVTVIVLKGKKKKGSNPSNGVTNSVPTQDVQPMMNNQQVITPNPVVPEVAPAVPEVAPTVPDVAPVTEVTPAQAPVLEVQAEQEIQNNNINQ